MVTNRNKKEDSENVFVDVIFIALVKNVENRLMSIETSRKKRKRLTREVISV